MDGSKVAERYGLAAGEKIIPGTMYIGQFQTSDGTFNNRAFFGYLSHFNMWNMELSENKIKKMSLGCGAEIGNLIQWPDLKAWTKKVSMEEPASCKTRGKRIFLGHINFALCLSFHDYLTGDKFSNKLWCPIWSIRSIARYFGIIS